MSFIVKNTTFPSLSDLIAPHSCRGCGYPGSPLCDCCKKYILNNYYSLCPICKTKSSGSCTQCNELPPTYALGERGGLLETLIHDYKYQSVRALGKTLANLLNDSLPPLPDNTIIVPLPTSTRHIRERGFDHTLLIAKHLAKLRHLKLQKLLLRAKNSTQVGADHNTRLKQAKEAYIINQNIPIDTSTTYLLLDDVWTTGASMQAAIKKLRKAGAHNIIVALLAVSRLD